MTFRSLKSRRTTASNGATANSFRRALAAFCLCGVAAANIFVTNNLNAAEPTSTLRWKTKGQVAAPPRPLPEFEAAPTTARAKFIVDHQVRLTQGEDPLKDPFGDKAGPAKPALPPANATPPSPLAPSPLAPLPPRELTPPPSPTDLPTLPPIPTDDRQAFTGIRPVDEPCPKPSDLKPISQLTNVIAAKPGQLPKECMIDDRVEPSLNRTWGDTVYTWKASGLCHKPLYFEEQSLERYGHSTGPFSQPFVSGAHFFLTVPVLPYKMGLKPPHECEYALGYYRPGSCAPYIVPPVPISARAIAAETAAALGLIYALP